MENNKFKVESLIMDVELATESLGVILQDQEQLKSSLHSGSIQKRSNQELHHD